MSKQPEPTHKKLNFGDCTGMAIGQIIGSGVMVLTGVVIGMTGHGTPYAYILGALVAIITCVPFIILTSTIVLWFLQGYGFVDGVFGAVEDADASLLAVVAGVVAPIFAPLGVLLAGLGDVSLT